MPPVLGPRLASSTALWSSAVASSTSARRRTGHHGTLAAEEALFNHHGAPASPKLPVPQHGAGRGLGFLVRRRHYHALPAHSPSALTTTSPG